MSKNVDNTTTRAVIANSIYKNVGVSNSVACEITDCFFDEVIDALKSEEHVKISKFGSFYLKSKAQRMGRNPKTKEEAVIPPRNTVSFYASNFLKEKINK